MVILPSAYMPSVEYVARLLREECVIDLGENYIKRSERNRASILSANGVMQLTVNVENANRPRQKMRDVKIDYSKRWQHQHWIALVSAYKRTPYFDYYADFFRPFYEQETRFLVDFNEKIHDVIIRLIANDEPRTKSQEQRLITTVDWAGQDLEQAFGNGQSILDILFEYGPESVMKI